MKNNSLKERYPIIAEQWHPTKNRPIQPEDISRSSNKKFWWKCNRGHIWQATVNNRTNKFSGCPRCSAATSRGEMRIAAELGTIFDVLGRHKIDKNEIDIFLPTINIGIEYDGAYWHGGNELRDIKKNKFFEKRDIKILRIREKPLEPLNQDCLIIDEKTLSKNTLNELLVMISKFCNDNQKSKINEYIENKKFRADNKFMELLSFYPSPGEDKNFEFVNPEIAKEWDYKKNDPLTPRQVSFGSEMEYWWKCYQGHEWKASPKHRNRSPKCPTCNHDSRRLDLTNPDLAERWHPIKNNKLSPKDFTIGSSRLVWWKCSENHECRGTISSRHNGYNCISCPLSKTNQVYNDKILMNYWDYERNKSINLRNLTTGSSTEIYWRCEKGHSWLQSPRSFKKNRICPECSNLRGSISRTLRNVDPDIFKELHPTKNNPSIESISYGSKKKVWWRCEQGHEWQMTVNSRTAQNQSCPYCSGKRLSNLNAIQITHPEISNMWHPIRNKNMNISETTYSSNKRVWWICDKGHEWEQSPNVMTSQKRKYICYQCYIENNSLTNKYPELSHEWDFNRNGNTGPESITSGSGKKFWWVCDHGHSWQAIVKNRVKGAGCPKCYNEKKIKG